MTIDPPGGLVPRDTTHLVLSREAGQLEDFSPMPAEKAGLLLSFLGVNLTAQAATWLVATGLWSVLSPWQIATGGVVFALAAARMLTGPALMRRWVMGRPSRRLRGRVEAAESTVTTPGSGRPAVLVRTVFPPASSSGWPRMGLQEDLRGVPFHLRLDDGRAVRIEPVTLWLVEKLRPVPWLTIEDRQALRAPWRGFLRRTVLQVSLHPGDEIEVLGRLETDVDQAGVGAPARGVPLVTFLRPLSGQVIWARRIKAAG